jgi:hypothetical protein
LPRCVGGSRVRVNSVANPALQRALRIVRYRVLQLASR